MPDTLVRSGEVMDLTGLRGSEYTDPCAHLRPVQQIRDSGIELRHEVLQSWQAAREVSRSEHEDGETDHSAPDICPQSCRPIGKPVSRLLHPTSPTYAAKLELRFTNLSMSIDIANPTAFPKRTSSLCKTPPPALRTLSRRAKSPLTRSPTCADLLYQARECRPPLTFFFLPAHLRHRIYVLVLTSIDTVHSFMWDPSQSNVLGYRNILVTQRQPPLTHVCRQIRRESLPVYYAENTWAVALHRDLDFRRFGWWAEEVGEANLAHLRRVRMQVEAGLASELTVGWEGEWGREVRRIVTLAAELDSEGRVRVRSNFKMTRSSERLILWIVGDIARRRMARYGRGEGGNERKEGRERVARLDGNALVNLVERVKAVAGVLRFLDSAYVRDGYLADGV